MPETAEVLREPEAQTSWVPPLPAMSPGVTSDVTAPAQVTPGMSMAGSALGVDPLAGYRGALQRQQDALQQRNATVGPQIDRAIQAGEQRVQAVADNPPPPAPVIPPPPPNNLHAFLAPTSGEAPEQSVSKFITALSVFGAGIGGLVKGSARAALAALTGALEGWHAGDKEKADREFASWKAHTDTALKNYHLLRSQWQDWFEATGLSVDQMTKGAHLAMLKAGLPVDLAQAEVDGLGYQAEFWAKRDKEAADLQRLSADLEYRRERAKATDEYHAATLAQKKDHDDKMAALKERELSGAVDAATPEVVDKLAEARLRGEAFPPNMMRGKSGQQLALKVDARVVELAKARGIDPAQLSGIKSDLDAKRAALKKLEATTVMSEAQAKRFDTHLEAAVQLSAKLDNSGIPVWERMRRKAKGHYGGDADVARLELQMNEVAMEYAKLTVGTAQGDAATRDEARKIFNAWMAHPQLEAVAEQAKQNAANNVENNRAAARDLTHYIDTIGGLVDKPAPKPPPVILPNDAKKAAQPPKPGMVRVKRKSDGVLGWLDPAKMGDKYEAASE